MEGVIVIHVIIRKHIYSVSGIQIYEPRPCMSDIVRSAFNMISLEWDFHSQIT